MSLCCSVIPIESVDVSLHNMNVAGRTEVANGQQLQLGLTFSLINYILDEFRFSITTVVLFSCRPFLFREYYVRWVSSHVWLL